MRVSALGYFFIAGFFASKPYSQIKCRDDNVNNREAAHWLTMIRALPAHVANKMLSGTGTPEAVCQADTLTLQGYGLKASMIDALQRPAADMIETDLLWLQQADHHLVTIRDSRYPYLLRQIPDPPLALFVRGDVTVLEQMQIGMVGSRRPTNDGCRLAGEFAGQLAECGIVVTSGLARGIDTCAHQGSLSAGGKTVAVLGNGLNSVYPASNKKLAESIVKNGALVSEFPLDYSPRPHNFPRRNRIISGLSLGVLVVEAAAQSGSLITARHALEQGREVFAVPGSIRNPMSRGCHALLRDGAKLVEQLTDILEEIGSLARMSEINNLAGSRGADLTKGLDAEAKVLLDNIGYDPVTVDELVEMTALPVNIMTARLLTLEVTNLIESLPGGSYVRK